MIKNSSIQNSATPKPCILDDFGRRRTQIYKNKSRTNAAESAIRQGSGAGSNYYCYPNRLVNTYPEKVFYNGSDEMLLSGLSAGAHGGIGTTYNFMPELFVRIHECFKAADITGAQEAQSVANSVIATVLKHGVLPASKYMVSLSGVPYGECREPFLPLDENAKADLYENAWAIIEDFKKKI